LDCGQQSKKEGTEVAGHRFDPENSMVDVILGKSDFFNSVKEAPSLLAP
jgi:hypothetical protein